MEYILLGRLRCHNAGLSTKDLTRSFGQVATAYHAPVIAADAAAHEVDAFTAIGAASEA